MTVFFDPPRVSRVVGDRPSKLIANVRFIRFGGRYSHSESATPFYPANHGYMSARGGAFKRLKNARYNFQESHTAFPVDCCGLPPDIFREVSIFFREWKTSFTFRRLNLL